MEGRGRRGGWREGDGEEGGRKGRRRGGGEEGEGKRKGVRGAVRFEAGRVEVWVDD